MCVCERPTRRYRKLKEKEPLFRLMKHFLPDLQQRLVKLMTDPSKASIVLQKLILKIFYALNQHSLNMKIVHKEQVCEWLELCRQIVARREHLDEFDATLDADEKEALVQWKCKKWAMLILAKLFERWASRRCAHRTTVAATARPASRRRSTPSCASTSPCTCR